MKKKYNWVEIQKAYDTGLSYKDLQKLFDINSDSTLSKAAKRGDLKPRTSSDTKALKRMVGVKKGCKRCAICRKIKKLDSFNKKVSSYDGLQPHCRICNKQSSKEYYKKNKKYHTKAVSQRNKKVLQENRLRLCEFLLVSKCIDCGETDPLVLEFDHRNPKEKKTEVSNLLRNGFSWAKIMEEINKCDVRCSNCHKRKTHKEQNSYRYKFCLRS